MTEVNPTKNRGRPRLQIDLARVEKLAALCATEQEIAALLGISLRSVARLKRSPAYQDAYERGRAHARTKLRRWQWQLAAKGHAAMLIFLGKAILGQRETGPDEQEEVPSMIRLIVTRPKPPKLPEAGGSGA
jgi:hypothetical protein